MPWIMRPRRRAQRRAGQEVAVAHTYLYDPATDLACIAALLLNEMTTEEKNVCIFEKNTFFSFLR